MPDGPLLAEPSHLDNDCLPIFRSTYGAAFGWDVHRALELAIFHSFAVPSISTILDQTGEFAYRGQKRYDDTVALMREIAANGPFSPRGRAAIKHLNWIHRAYNISNPDFIYVLATFVVIPVRWITRYGWRDLTEDEIGAAASYYRLVGRLMGIRRMPTTYAGFADYLDAYERDHHSFTEANQRLAVSLIKVMEGWVPQPLRPLARHCVTAALGRPLRRALGLPEPSGFTRAGVHAVLRIRARLIRLIPPLRQGRKCSRELRSYPHGYELRELGPAWAVRMDPGSADHTPQ